MVKAISRVRWFDRMWNVRVREMYGGRKNLNERVMEAQLKWCGYMERMGKKRMIKTVYKSEVDEG